MPGASALVALRGEGGAVRAAPRPVQFAADLIELETGIDDVQDIDFAIDLLAARQIVRPFAEEFFRRLRGGECRQHRHCGRSDHDGEPRVAGMRAG